MLRENSKTTFTKDEYERIKDLIRQLEEADKTKQKSIRQRIRNIGLYWKELPDKMEYTVANFEKLFDMDILRLTANRLTANEMSVEVKTANTASSNIAKSAVRKGREQSDESYIIDLCDEVLGIKASRQHKFDFLTGDAGHKLPVDAYYETLRLVVEYHERQHTESVAFFDRRLTVSGVSRGEQRRIYDQRREQVLPEHGIRLVVISYSDFGTTKKLTRNRNNDILVVKRLLCEYMK